MCRFAAYGATKRSVVHLTKSLQVDQINSFGFTYLFMCQTLVNFFFFQSDAFKSRFHKIHTQKRAISQLII